MGEGSDGAALGQPGLAHHGKGHLHLRLKLAVFNQGARTNAAAVANAVVPPKMALGLHHHVLAKAGASAEATACRIQEADASRQPLLP